MDDASVAAFRQGPLPGTLLPDYDGLGVANVAPTILGHFGAIASLPPLAAAALPPDLLDGVDRVVTLLIDALGYDRLLWALESGAAPRLASLRRRAGASLSALTSTFPSTTVVALTTLATGLPPARHGVVGERFYDAGLGATIHVLSFRPAVAGVPLSAAGVDPATWLGVPTLFEQLAPLGVGGVVLDHAEFEGSALSRMSHRGARCVGFHTIADLCANLRAAVEATPAPAYLHAYWGTLDTLAHRYGAWSAQSTAELRVLDHAIGELFLGGLRAPRTLLLLLADHGQIDTAPERWTWLNDHPDFLALVQAPPAGDHRAALLYVLPGREAAAREYVEEQLDGCAYALDAESALRLGLYGPGSVAATARQRIGQLLVLARGDRVVRYEYPGKERKVWQVGTHGGLARQEMLVPLLALRLD